MRCPGEHLSCHVCGRLTTRRDRYGRPVCMTHDAPGSLMGVGGVSAFTRR